MRPHSADRAYNRASQRCPAHSRIKTRGYIDVDAWLHTPKATPSPDRRQWIPEPKLHLPCLELSFYSGWNGPPGTVQAPGKNSQQTSANVIAEDATGARHCCRTAPNCRNSPETFIWYFSSDSPPVSVKFGTQATRASRLGKLMPSKAGTSLQSMRSSSRWSRTYNLSKAR